MQIVDDEQVLALSFVAAANHGGCRPSMADVEEWLRLPGRQPTRKGPLIKKGRPARSALLDGAMQGIDFSELYKSTLADIDLTQYTRGILQEAFRGLTVPGEPDVYGPDVPGETLVGSLIRLRWLEVADSDGLILTRLGAALLRSSEMLDSEQAVATTVLLGAEDELAYPQLIHRLTEAGAGAVVDPYLRLAQFAEIVTHTEISQFLISERLSKSDLASIAVFVGSRNGGPIEVRVAKRGVLHDRMIICDEFVDTIGSSFNTVGKQHPTVLSPLPTEAADAMRDHFRKWWDEAEVLAAGHQSEPEP